MSLLRNNINNGFFITFEGSEAVGKSTLITKFSDYLKECNIDYIQTREPGGTVLAEKIRSLIFNETPKPSILTELLLLFAARQSHLQDVIRPALASNKVVICDRYIDSTYVYQSVMNGIPASLIDNLVNDFTKPTLPNVCFIIDCPAEESHKRIKKRGILNDYDNQSVEYFHKIRKGFLNRPTNNKLYPYYVIENNILETTVKQIIDIFNSISEL